VAGNFATVAGNFSAVRAEIHPKSPHVSLETGYNFCPRPMTLCSFIAMERHARR
jgi:hypothetical protein